MSVSVTMISPISDTAIPPSVPSLRGPSTSRPPNRPRTRKCGLRTCIRLLRLSATYTSSPPLLVATSTGRLNCPGSQPKVPISSMYSPLGPSFWTRSFPASATYRFPTGSRAIPIGCWNSPCPLPLLPNTASNRYATVNFATAFAGLSEAARPARPGLRHRSISPNTLTRQASRDCLIRLNR